MLDQKKIQELAFRLLCDEDESLLWKVDAFRLLTLHCY